MLNGVLFTFAETLIDPTLVLVAFVSQFTTSPIWIGLIGPLRDGAWNLPQFWISSWLQSQPRKLRLYRIASAVRVVMWTPLLMEIAPPAERTLYLGFNNTLSGIVLLSTSLSGVIVALLGLPSLVAMTVIAYGVAVRVALRVREDV